MTSDASPQSIQSAKAAVESLAAVLGGGALPDTLASGDDPAAALLHDGGVARAVVGRLRGAGSGVGNDGLCRWLYDAFQSNLPELQLAVLRFVPALAGVYMSRAVSRKQLAGFEAVLLALYAHAAAQRGAGEPETVALPNLANPSVYHDAKVPPKTKAAELDVAVLSPALEPHGTMRATRRARIVGAVLELYHGKLALMPISSKLDFCEFCVAWAGNRSKLDDKPRIAAPASSEPDGGGAAAATEEKWRRVPLPWELFQPAMRIVAHCLLGPTGSDELKAQAARAAECLYWRAAETMDARALLATRSLVRLSQMMEEPIPEPSFSGGVENMAELEAMRANILSTKN
uniref:Hyccin n=1 Tax=Leersia perrieri TaxID=77586 RepID=A0A0D9VYC3_9ORYZ